MSYELLSEPVRRYIRDKRWDALRAIQVAAISKILTTDDNYILASRTASGKTEAAFLPILTKVDFRERGIQVLYISPLIALINDQFQRVEELCKHLDVTVTKWHGEASKSLKDKLIKEPKGILLITPESIEAMFVNHPYYVKTLFSNLKFVVIDEIHSFIGSNRGIQLKSLLSRIKQSVPHHVRTIGLSATIGDYDEAKKFTGEEARTKVLLDKTPKELNAKFKYIKTEAGSYSVAFIEDLYEQTKDKKVLIFPNSRGNAEEIAVKLKKTAERNNGHPFYFSHHSSVDKELREYIEHFAKNNERQYFCIACTSTLELGIDIGSVDMVVQIDSTFSVASLIQRVGRSGRKESIKSNLLLYATEHWQLLQSIACWQLYKESFIEPIYSQTKPFDIHFQQILSILRETSGCNKEALITRLKSNAAFANLSLSEIESLILYMIGADYVEDLKRELIIGYEGEKLVNSREFYSVFETLPTFKVIHSGKSIGDIPFSPMITEGENMLLAARIWKIMDVDMDAKKIFVVPAYDGKKPMFFGEGGNVHLSVRKKMLEILYSDFENSGAYEDSAISIINEMQLFFKPFPVNDFDNDRPIVIKEKSIEFYTFSGTKINKTISFLLKSIGLENDLHDSESMIEIKSCEKGIDKVIDSLRKEILNIGDYVEKVIKETPAFFIFSKWGKYLPGDLNKAYILETYFDISGMADFINNLRIAGTT